VYAWPAFAASAANLQQNSPIGCRAHWNGSGQGDIGFLLVGPADSVEDKCDVAAQTDDAVARNLGIADGLGETATSYGVPLEGAGIVGDGDLR
jgi:hypothetical protein